MKGKPIILSCMLILLLLVGFIYFFLNGNPVTRAESKEIVIEYLQTHYPKETFSINGISYYPGEGTYIVNVITKDGTIQGNIDVRDGIITADSLDPYNSQ
jgi:lipopolysaccharide export LptBFGC system permease protein LptF